MTENRPGLGDRDGPLTHYQAAALDYRRRLGWWATARGSEVWTSPGHPLEALIVPVDIARSALIELWQAGASTPVARMPGPPAERWLFLTQPGAVPVEEIAAIFPFDGEIGYAHRGPARHQAVSWGIGLPPTRHPGSEPWSWITPDGTTLAPLLLVVGAVLRAVNR